MIDRRFFKAGHTPTLLAAFFYFDMSFMVWVLLGPLGVQIAKDLGFDAVVATMRKPFSVDRLIELVQRYSSPAAGQG